MSIHSTQLEILNYLRASSTGFHYSDIKPPDLENDLYNYHLQQLVKKGCITKIQGKYFLCESGKELLLELHPIDSKTASSHKFKLAVITMILSKTAGNAEILYQTRTRQPFMGRQEIIGGGIRRGESVVTAAKRRLKEEAGLEADFRIFGLLRKMRFSDDHRLYSDILYHVCLSTEYRGILIGENEFGENYWMPLDNAIRIEMTAPYGSKKFGEILKQLHEVDEKLISLFYIEEQYTQNIY